MPDPLVYWDLLNMAWDVLYWVVTYVWVFCLILFVMIMIKTMFDLARKLGKIASPGWGKFFKKSGLR